MSCLNFDMFAFLKFNSSHLKLFAFLKLNYSRLELFAVLKFIYSSHLELFAEHVGGLNLGDLVEVDGLELGKNLTARTCKRIRDGH